MTRKENNWNFGDNSNCYHNTPSN